MKIRPPFRDYAGARGMRTIIVGFLAPSAKEPVKILAPRNLIRHSHSQFDTPVRAVLEF
jgi:hypothetical protein